MEDNELRDELKTRFMYMAVRCHGLMQRIESEEHTTKSVVALYKDALEHDLKLLNTVLDDLCE